MTKSLWPDEISIIKEVPPTSILKEQAALLGEKTQNLVIAEVEPKVTPYGDFYDLFYLVAPALDKYSFELFTVWRKIDGFYPIQIASSALGMNKEENVINSEEALGSQNGIRKIVNRSSLNVLNSKDFLPGKRAVNDPQGYGWDLFGCKMRPDEIVQNPVGIQTLLQSGFLLGVSVGLTAVTGHASS